MNKIQVACNINQHLDSHQKIRDTLHDVMDNMYDDDHEFSAEDIMSLTNILMGEYAWAKTKENHRSKVKVSEGIGELASNSEWEDLMQIHRHALIEAEKVLLSDRREGSTAALPYIEASKWFDSLSGRDKLAIYSEHKGEKDE